METRARWMAVALVAATMGCGSRDRGHSAAAVRATLPVVDSVPPAADIAALARALDSLPDDARGQLVRRGHAFVANSHDSLTAYTSSNLNCTSCHLDDGQRPNAAPLIGAYARYPRYVDRAGETATIEDRVNYCVTRSLAGRTIPDDAPQMQAIVAYLAFLSRGPLADSAAPGRGMPTLPRLAGDSVRGVAVFNATCARCHGADGAGLVGPALWGPRSFDIGASMARESRAASFIRRNMPFDAPNTLTDQQAYDVAAYIASMPRPDFTHKADDWPHGGAPYDVPYDTKGHSAFHRPRLSPAVSAAPADVH